MDRKLKMSGAVLVAAVFACAVAVPAHHKQQQHVFTPTSDPNMNGKYEYSRTPNAPTDKTFPTDFKDYPGGLEYFEVYHGPIKSVYSEVFWTTLSNPLPQEIVDRFDGKAMAIVGYEIDQVRRTPEGDVSVPINMAYNHHHDTAVVSKKHAHMETVDRSDPRVDAAGRHFVRLDKGKVWLPVEDTPSPNGVPTSAMFSDGNGGEYRKSLHIYAPPYAQMVESPTDLSGSPMQIDTWNRDKMSINGTSPFVPGPVPAHSLAPTSGPDAIYSGLLECPLTTRIQKVLEGGSTGFNDSYTSNIFSCSDKKMCSTFVNTSTTCFTAVSEILNSTSFSTSVVSDTSIPPGCSASFTNGKVQAVFNTNNQSTACCGVSDITVGSASSLVDVDVSISSASKEVTITVAGPSDVWFGVGFNSSQMDNTYAIVVDGSGKVTEHLLGNHEVGTQLDTTVSITDNNVTGSIRTVTMTRSIVGKSSQYYTFDPMALALDFINAIGSTPTLSYHKEKTADTMNLWPSSGSACICSHPAAPFGYGKGSIKYIPSGEVIGFRNQCDPEPRTDLLRNRNPTCDIRTYAGGLSTCHHSWLLLDADQEIPWQDQPLEYYKKFRIYFQEYNASFHQQIQRNDWGIGADGDHAEYDVPQCPPGTPTKECTHTIQGTWIPITSPDVYIVAAHFHCHAPTCLKVDMYVVNANGTKDLLCSQEPIYGGTGKIDLPTFDEPGYIATPPCLWGRNEDGLESPPLVSGKTIQVVATTNNTYGHHGEMALPEVSLVHLS